MTAVANREAIISSLDHLETHDHPESQGVVLSDKHVAYVGITSLGQKLLFDPHWSNMRHNKVTWASDLGS